MADQSQVHPCLPASPPPKGPLTTAAVLSYSHSASFSTLCTLISLLIFHYRQQTTFCSRWSSNGQQLQTQLVSGQCLVIHRSGCGKCQRPGLNPKWPGLRGTETVDRQWPWNPRRCTPLPLQGAVQYESGRPPLTGTAAITSCRQFLL